MPSYIVSQLYCRICGNELNGQCDWGCWWEFWCLGCGWHLEGQEARHEFEAIQMGLGADIPVGGYVLDEVENA